MNRCCTNRWLLIVAVAAVIGAPLAGAQNVKITPLRSHTGELCDRDRATIFEDPTGVRILYDARQSVTGANEDLRPARSCDMQDLRSIR